MTDAHRRTAQDRPAAEPRATMRRQPGGVRLPVALSLVLLLVLSGCFALVGQGGGATAPESVVRERSSYVHATGEAIRKGLDEATDDLTVLALRLQGAPGRRWPRLLQDFASVHGRYLCVYVVGPDRTPRLRTGRARPHAELLPGPLPTVAGITGPEVVGSQPVLLAYAPLRTANGAPQLLVGRYDVTHFSPVLEQLRPGNAYLVDAGGRIVDATHGFRARDALPSSALRQAASTAAATGFGATADRGGITSYAVVSGASPGGSLGLVVLAHVSSSELRLPAYDARRRSILMAVLTALVGSLSLLWLHVLVVAPARRLASQAKRIADGDEGDNREVRRYDEIGLTTRALARCRDLLAQPRGR